MNTGTDTTTHPVYSELQAIPTRSLPDDLKAKEASAAFSTAADVIQQGLLKSAARPDHDAALFTALVSSNRRGVLTFDVPEGQRCLPVFTTPFRAADYREVLVGHEPKVGYLASTPRELLQLLRDIERAGIEMLALDRCPRCSTFTVIRGGSLKTADDIVTIWSISKSTELARLELYVTHALEMARAGHFTLAKDVALETVGHVSAEDPRVHLLLGELGVALREPTLTDEATRWLRLLKVDLCERTLNEIVESGSATFATSDYSRGHPQSWG